MTTVWIVIGVIVLILIVWACVTYNNLITLRNRTANGWSQIDVVLKQRADLVPNLVQTVKGYAAHESSVFEKVTQARADAMRAAQDPQTTPENRAAVEDRLTRAIADLRAVAENYPQLQASQNFMNLQNQLSELESRIAYARQFYNDVVLKYNNAVQHVPSNIIAGLFHFTTVEYFRVQEQDRAVPTVSF